MAGELATILVITAAAFAAPLISDHLRRWVIVPATVLEIALGIALGPDGLGWITETEAVSLLAELGIALLIFMAGYELDFDRMRGRPLRQAGLAWTCSLAIGLGIGLGAFGLDPGALILGLALTTTALGTVLPILRDAGRLGGAFGARFLASGTFGEFAPIVVIAVLLSGHRPIEGSLLPVVFFLIAGAAVWLARRGPSQRAQQLLRTTLGTSAQWAVRVTMLIVVGLVYLAASMGLDSLLGAFAAGVVVRWIFAQMDETEQVESKLDAVAFGFFIPLFFVVTGVRFDLAALLSDPRILLLTPALMLVFLLVRGGPELLFSAGALRGRERWALACLSATALPLVVVLTTIGTDSGHISTALAAALVGAAMLSVLILPQAGISLLSRATGRTPSPATAGGSEAAPPPSGHDS